MTHEEANNLAGRVALYREYSENLHRLEHALKLSQTPKSMTLYFSSDCRAGIEIGEEGRLHADVQHALRTEIERLRQLIERL